MTKQETFLRALFANSDTEKLVNFKLYPGSNRDTTPDEVYDVLTDSINKERMGRLTEIFLEDEEKNLKDLTLDDIKRM